MDNLIKHGRLMELLIIAIAPVVLLGIFIYRKDECMKEPASLLTKLFFGGIGAVILTLLTGELFSVESDPNESLLWYLFGEAFIEAALPEELFKFFFLMIIAWKSKHFDEHFDGIIYAAFVALGFACVENIVYVFENGVGTGIMRAILAVPGHFLDGILMGYYLSLAKFGPQNKKMRNLMWALLVPMIAHGVYDSCCFSFEYIDEDNLLIVVLVFIFFIVFNVKLWKQCLKRIHEQAEKDKASRPAIASDENESLD